MILAVFSARIRTGREPGCEIGANFAAEKRLVENARIDADRHRAEAFPLERLYQLRGVSSPERIEPGEPMSLQEGVAVVAQIPQEDVAERDAADPRVPQLVERLPHARFV